MTALTHLVRMLAPAVVMLYVLYLVVFLTAQVALQGVTALVVGPWAVGRLVAVVRHRGENLT